MQSANAQRIENALGYAAAASFAAAVGFAAFHVTGGVTALRGVFAGGAATIVAYPGARVLLRLLEGQPKPFRHASFNVVELEPLELDELVLTDADRVQPAGDAPLELNDILAEIAPDSRVVQLFDPSSMPTPGELKDRIDRHAGGTSHAAPPDASDALLAALADLRRSLR